MAILKKEKKTNYTIISNNIFKDKSLSLKAKGLLCLMLSLPDMWEFTEQGLATLSADGLASTKTAIK